VISFLKFSLYLKGALFFIMQKNLPKCLFLSLILVLSEFSPASSAITFKYPCSAKSDSHHGSRTQTQTSTSENTTNSDKKNKSGVHIGGECIISSAKTLPLAMPTAIAASVKKLNQHSTKQATPDLTRSPYLFKRRPWLKIPRPHQMGKIKKNKGCHEPLISL
jgi:hypothetical protein